jgi:glycosyltransferase involved in cell wall biosynthesis
VNILFVHQNFPGQFRHLATTLQAGGHVVRALCVQGAGLPGIDTLRHQPQASTIGQGHPWVRDLETKVTRGASALEAMAQLQHTGWTPDLVVAHPAWGEALFVKDLWPRCLLLCYAEFYYAAEGLDVGFDHAFGPVYLATRARLRLKNVTHLLALEAMDMGWSPTQWQRSSFPAAWQERLRVVFDGIDTRRARPDAQARLVLRSAQGGDRPLKAGDEVLTFVARNLEPYRGYHMFMRALPAIQRQRPDAVTLIVGGHDVSYGTPAPQGHTWKDVFLNEVRDQLDLSRVFFLGHLSYERYMKVLQVSACHVYLTYPFVLSWSCLEALASGCLVVGSRTGPVQEVISHGVNGVLCDFFDSNALSQQVADVLGRPRHYRALRERARADTIAHYDLQQVCLPRQLALLDELTSGGISGTRRA